MKVHIVSYNLDQKKFSKSKIHILPNYEQTDLKTAIVLSWLSIFIVQFEVDKGLKDDIGCEIYPACILV